MTEALAAISFSLKVWLLSRKEQPLWLFFYVGAMMLAMAAEWPVKWEFGAASQAYLWTWVCSTALVLVFVAVAVWEHIRLLRYKLRAFAVASLIALVPARMSYLGDWGHHTLTDKLITAEGFLLLLAGLLVGGAAPHTRRPDLSLIVALFWIGQSTFDWGWILHWPAWNAASWILGPSMGIVAFLLLAWRLWKSPSRASI